MNPLFENTTGFIFDCDGTLLDTMGAWNELEEDLFSQATIPFTNEEIDEVRSLPIQLGAQKFFEHGIGESPEAILDVLDNALLSFYRESVLPLPNAVEFVRAAVDAGIVCTVVSSSPQRYIQAGLSRVGISDAFAKIISTEDVNLSKLDPRIYQHAMEVMGSTPQTTWGFDDALYAINAMKGIGIHTCGCYDHDETGTYEQLAEAAEVAIRSFTELL